MDAAFLTARIEKVKAIIIAYQDAILAISSGAVQSYTIDTGQTRQTVTKMDLDKLDKILQTQLNLLATLNARLNGGVVIGAPCW